MHSENKEHNLQSFEKEGELYLFESCDLEEFSLSMDPDSPTIDRVLKDYQPILTPSSWELPNSSLTIIL